MAGFVIPPKFMPRLAPGQVPRQAAPRRQPAQKNQFVNNVRRAANNTALGRMPVAQRQRYLRQRGYEVGVDGVMGPNTYSASYAYTHGMAPRVYNAQGTGWQHRIYARRSGPTLFNRIAHGVQAGVRSTQAPRPHAGRGSVGAPARVPRGAGRVRPGRGRGGRAPVQDIGAADTAAPTPDTGTDPALGDVNYIDPVSYAQSEMDAVYGPQISELSRQMAARTAAAKAAQFDIGNWYQQVQGAQGAATSADQAELDKLLAGSDAAGQGAINALGGGASDAAGSAAAWNAITRGETAQTGAADTHYDTELAPIIGLQGADAKRAQMSSDAGAMQDLAAKMSDLYASEGSDYTKALSDAQDQSMQQRMAVLNAKTQEALLPSQLADAKLGVASKRLSIRQQRQAMRTQALNNKIAKAKLRLAQRDASGNEVVPSWNKLDPGKLSGLRDDLVSGVVSKKDPSKLMVDPIQVYNQWGNTIRGVSNSKWDPKSNTQIRTWRDQLLSSYLPRWNQNHPGLRYAIRNGVLIRLPNIKVPKKRKH